MDKFLMLKSSKSEAESAKSEAESAKCAEKCSRVMDFQCFGKITPIKLMA